jgi:hypothetical protein
VQAQNDFRTDEIINLELQRWAGLAPVFNPSGDPMICQGLFCYNGVLTTTRFSLTGIYPQYPTAPVDFAYPNGQVVNYTRRHYLGEVDYPTCDHLWLLALSEGGNMPATPNAPTGCRQALAAIGRPGIYRFEGTLHLVATWTLPLVYTYEWDMPITFYVAQRAPVPRQP